MAKSSKSASKKSSGKRTLIAPKGDKRYIKRDAKGRIKESDDQGRSLSQDRKKKAKTEVKPGYGNQDDQPKRNQLLQRKNLRLQRKKSAPRKAASSRKGSKK